MKRTTNMSRISKRPKKIPSRVPLALIVSTSLAVGTAFLVLAAVLGTAGVGIYRYYQSVVPDGIQALTSYEQQPYQISLVTDRKGYTLQELVNPKLGVRQLVPLSQIPKNMINAEIDIENRTFWTDPGVDPVRLVEAGYHDVGSSAGLQGASTLTQQLVKLGVFNTNAGTPRKLDQSGLQRKLKEIMIAIGVTRDIAHCNLHCRKEAILQMYLNTVPYGDQTYGVEAASQYYFGKPAAKLDLAQSALLAGIPQAPSEYDPLYNLKNGLHRQHQVLDAMVTQHDITPAQAAAARVEDIQHELKFKNPVVHKASQTIESYFVDWLVNVYLKDPANLAAFHIPDLQQPDDIYRGFVFKTTLDPEWQATAQNTVNQQVAQLGSLNVTDGALVSIDPHSNEIRAFVGGVGYNAQINCPECDMAWLPRQPGSSFKPFVYVTAFENGHFPGEAINDAPVQFPDGSESGGYYTPKNYDLSYHGMVTIRKALANSYNIPAVKTLYSLTPSGATVSENIRKVLKTVNSMGYHLRTQDPKKLGLSFALGADEGRLLDEVNAYTVFANGGIYRPYMPILAIYRRNTDGSLKQVWQYHTPKGVQVLAPQFAYEITSILSDTAAKVPAFGDFAFSLLGLGDRPVAAKTGTTNDFKDNLTMGYTPDITTGVWVGNPNDTQMQGTTGVTGAAPIWHQFMSTVLADTPINQFIQPSGIITATVAIYHPPFSPPGLADNGYGSTDIFAAGTVPKTFDVPSQDDLTGTIQQPINSPSTTSPSTTSPSAGTQSNSGNPCNGGAYTYTTNANGQRVYTCH